MALTGENKFSTKNFGTSGSGRVEIFALLLKGLTCVVPNTNDLPELSIVAPDEDVVSA